MAKFSLDYDMPLPKAIKNPPPYGGRPKFVKFAPGDDGEFLPYIFYEGLIYSYHLAIFLRLSVDPHTFKPSPGPLGEIHAWGLYPVCGNVAIAHLLLIYDVNTVRVRG